MKQKKDIIIDSDVFNEIDDMWALSYLLNSEENINIKGICIAPFDNFRAKSVFDSIDKSYEAAIELLKLNGKEKYTKSIYKGARAFLTQTGEPVRNDATDALIEEANRHSKENPLYILEIAAITNMASALLLAPEIAEKIVIVWLGGHCIDWPRQDEFNMKGDLAASRVVLNSSVRLVVLPCMGVVSGLYTSEAEMRKYLGGKNPLCEYLINQTVYFKSLTKPQNTLWSVVFWDVSAIAWIVDYENKLILSKKQARPVLNEDLTYSFRTDAEIEYVYFIDRDPLINDLFKKLIRVNKKSEEKI